MKTKQIEFLLKIEKEAILLGDWILADLARFQRIKILESI